MKSLGNFLVVILSVFVVYELMTTYHMSFVKAAIVYIGSVIGCTILVTVARMAGHN